MVKGINTKITFLLIVALSVTLFNCGGKKMTDKERASAILSSRNLGLAYLEDNKLPEAEAEFKKLIDLDPKESMGYANLGVVYLRMGKMEEAEKQIQQGLDLDPDNADIMLILATVYDMSNREDDAVSELQAILKKNPGYVKALFMLSDIYSKKNEEGASAKREGYLKGIVKYAPRNLVGRLYLTESLMDNQEYDSALVQLEDLNKEFPEFPGESGNFFHKAVALLKAGKGQEAVTPVKIFHNFLKLTPAYQSGVQDLKGPRGDLIGFPVITMGETTSGYIPQGESILDALKFTDITDLAGLNTGKSSGIKVNYVTVGDYDNDGDHDVFLCITGKSGQAGMLFRDDMGTYTDVTKEAGIDIPGNGITADFSDYDNDGYVDLFVTTETGTYLLHNTGQGKFKDVTAGSGIDGKTSENFELFVDEDHDGDLDILTGNAKSNKLYRNNSDGTFLEDSKNAGIIETGLDTRTAAFGDFDDDGDIDLILANNNDPDILYTNLREGKFKNISSTSGIGDQKGSTAVAVGDYNNDGYLDLFIGSSGAAPCRLLQNKKDGTFMDDKNADEWLKDLNGIKCDKAEFFDFDNDGSMDLLVAGENPDKSKRGLYLFHNDGWGKFEDKSSLLPANILNAKNFYLADFNEDGDFDIYLVGPDGDFHLLRNDGGNANHYLKIKLVGLRTGSSKNNYYGIGSKLEVRAGALYQMKEITDPDVLVGIGNHARADVVRIQWTNGVSQNIFSPASNQDLVEQQELKGSCPFLYAWNGKEFVFVKDMLWKSALGMPMGIMGGNTAYAFPNASVEYIRLPGQLLKSENNKLQLKFTSELWEAIYTDQLNLIAVDHPSDMDIYVDEKFSPPPFAPLRIFKVREKHFPVTATDGFGNNVLPLLLKRDDKYVATMMPDQYQGVTEPSSLVLDPGTFQTKDSSFLFLQGWIFPTDASINFALSQNGKLKSIPPYLQVKNKKGQWVTVIDNIGFPSGKNKTVVVDLTGKYLSADHRVRILTNMQIYWDCAFFAGLSHEPVKVTWLDPESADLHYRGFSAMYRKGGRYGPHSFDYNKVTSFPKYRDLSGNYTRYGNVLPLLEKPDDKYIISNAGDEVSLTFDNSRLPELKKDEKRDYLIYSVGWVKDGDLNTATGNTVYPLPFHGMKEYPYGKDEHYPDDAAHLNYLKTYNTREVNDEAFKRVVADVKQ